MADYILNVASETSKLDWAFPFQRTGAFPLDRSSLFSSLTDAQNYALGLDENKQPRDERALGGTSYVGQPISVYDSANNSITLYVINSDRSLKAVGSAPLGDNASIEIVDGKVQLKDFGLSYYAYVPAEKNDAGEIVTPSGYTLTEGFKEGLEPRVRLEDGKYVIAWYEPSTETAADVSANLETLKQTVETLEGNLESVESSIETLQTEVDSKANAADVYTKTEIDTKLNELDHLKRTTVAGIESINLEAADADRYIYMVPNAETGNYDEYMVVKNAEGVNELEKVGDWSVDLSDYATIEDLDGKVDKDANARLMTNDEGTKLAGIQEGAEENFIKSASEDFSVSEEGHLSLNTLSKDKIDGLNESLTSLAEILGSKVDKEENARLMTEAEAAKLQSITDLIKSVNPANFTVSEQGQLNLNDINISKIIGLQDALNGKVDRVYSADGEEWTLLSPENQAKLAALVLEGDKVEISGTVNAENVQGLESWITSHASTVKGLSEYNFNLDMLLKLSEIEDGAQVNYISSVDETQMNVTDGHLSIIGVSPDIVIGLSDILDGKASTSTVTTLQTNLNNLQTQLNNYVVDTTVRLDDLDQRLTWQTIN